MNNGFDDWRKKNRISYDECLEDGKSEDVVISGWENYIMCCVCRERRGTLEDDDKRRTKLIK